MSDLLSEVPQSLLQPHQLDRYIPLLPKELKPEGYKPRLIALASITSFEWLTRVSIAGAEDAYSWRNYNVGAAVLAYNLDTRAMGITVGANFKPQEKGGPNIHAEQVALAKARLLGLNYIFGIAVWGDATDLDANPSQSPTLRPCRRCSDMFATLPEVKPPTLIVSGNADLSVCELYTNQELADYYQDPNAAGPVSDTPLYSLADNMDPDDYNDRIFIPYLIPKVMSLYPEPDFN